MRRRPFASLRHVAAIVGIAFLVGGGPIACGPALPSPDLDRERSEIQRPDAGELTYLLLRLGERRLYLMDDDPRTPVESFPIAVGREGRETPTGSFRVEEMIEHPDFHKFDPRDRTRVIKRIPPGPTNPLGERWIAFTHGDGWVVGIHGTPNPELLGRAVSGGCVRMRNADVIRVYERVQLGTTVIVEP